MSFFFRGAARALARWVEWATVPRNIETSHFEKYWILTPVDSRKASDIFSETLPVKNQPVEENQWQETYLEGKNLHWCRLIEMQKNTFKSENQNTWSVFRATLLGPTKWLQKYHKSDKIFSQGWPPSQFLKFTLQVHSVVSRPREVIHSFVPT